MVLENVEPHVQVQGDVRGGVLIDGEGCTGVQDCNTQQ